MVLIDAYNIKGEGREILESKTWSHSFTVNASNTGQYTEQRLSTFNVYKKNYLVYQFSSETGRWGWRMRGTYINLYFKEFTWKTETQLERESDRNLPSTVTLARHWGLSRPGQAEDRSLELNMGLCVGVGIQPLEPSITTASSRHTLAGSWNQVWSWDSNPGTPTWDPSIQAEF